MKSTTTPCCLYEHPALRSVTGATIRPGGLALTKQAFEYLSLPACASVLDVGCGNGATLRYLQGMHAFQLFGADLSALLLYEGRRENEWLNVVQAVGDYLPFKSGLFNAILAECSLSLMPDLRQSLLEIRRILRPGGYLVITDLYLRNQVATGASRDSRLSLMQCCLRGAQTEPELLSCFSEAGFSICFWKDCSEFLRSLTAQLVFNYGSMQNFWQKTLPGLSVPDAFDLQLAISKAKPGYFLCILHHDGEIKTS